MPEKSSVNSVKSFTIVNKGTINAFMNLTLTRVSYHVDVGCYLTIQTKLLYLLSGGSVLLASFLSSFAGTSGRFPSGGPSSLAFYIACSYQVFHLFLAHDVSEKLHLPVYHFT